MTMDTDDPRGQLSLVAQSDDLCRFINALISSEATVTDRCLELLKQNSEIRNKWSSAVDEIKQCHATISQLQKELKKKEDMNKNLLHRIDKEVKNGDKLREEKVSLKQKLDIIKQCLLDDSNERHPNRDRIMSVIQNIPQLDTLHEDSEDHSLSDLDYDKTGDDLEVSRRVSNGKRKSSNGEWKSSNGERKSNGVRRKSEAKEINKKPKSSDEDDLDMDVDIEEVEEAVEEFGGNGFHEAQPIQRTLFKSQGNFANPAPVRITTSSTPTLLKSPFEKPKSSESMEPRNEKPKNLESMEPRNEKKPKNLESMGPRLENKSHQWQHKNSVRPLKCSPCGGQIRWFSQYIACAQCAIHCHLECRNKVPNPCIPFVAKNRGAGPRKKWPLTDFVSKDKPMIPALVFHCCNEIERRGLTEVGLYRVGGSDKEIKQLKDHILSSKNGMPSLASYEIPVICGVLKEFLKCLEEPLVTTVLRKDFVRAAEAKEREEEEELLNKAVSELPPANRDTLAFLMAHLQKIAQSPACKMPIDNIAKVLAPTIVGEDSEVVNNQYPVPKMLTLIRQQFQVMRLLLNTPSGYWNECINRGSEPSTAFNSRRDSIEKRTFGGTVQTNGLLTPAHPPTSLASASNRSAYAPVNSAKKQLFMKPLF